MRVDDRNLAGVAASQSGKTIESRDVERASEGRAAESRGTTGPDRVHLSDLAGMLSRILSKDSAERANRVEQLTKLHQEGRYQANTRAVSSAILEEMRSAGFERA